MSIPSTVDVIVPQVGEAVAEVRLVRWLKAPGEPVKRGEPLFELDTDKALVEVEAFVDGTLVEIVVPEGGAVLPQQVVGRVLVADSKSPVTLAHTVSQPEPVTGESQVASPEPLPPTPAGERGERRAVSPKARRLAEQLGLILDMVQGTGPDGLVTVSDVEAAQRAASVYPAQAPSWLSRRQAIAERTLASKQQVPHFYLTVDADMTEARRLRAHCTAELDWPQPPTFTDLIVRATALALAAMPRVNVRYMDGQLEARPSVDIGVAIALDEGLMAPVLAGADQASLRATAEWLRAAAERARQGRLQQQDLRSKSLVVSNLGMYGIDSFIAIIDQPDPMILAVGRVADRVVPVAGQPAVRAMSTLTLSVDHRALDGAVAAQFLKQVQARLESSFDLLE
jgi:pyruvate dehydrogenase E2 component (dihydrolipoamide acetyltransferase)